MIPLSLNVRNFMSYTDVHEPLRFDGIHVAVLSGDNGHGKSALLDAITWVLWGQSRARSMDDLIHSGATEMEVEFEFLLDELQYRVVRKRQKRGKTSLADLQFAVLANGAYRSLTERSASETERVIRETLRMSYETFTNSSFIQQGRADSFTLNPPAERKRILAEILELGYYDQLEARAKDSLREREMQVSEERAKNREWEQEIARKPEYQADLNRVTGELAGLEDQFNNLDTACKVARERVARFESAQQGLEEAEAGLKRSLAERERAERGLLQIRQDLANHRQTLARAVEIERAATELASARATLGELDQKFQRYVPLMQRRQQAQASVDAETARLEAYLQGLMKQVTEQKPLAERLKTLDQDVKEATELAAGMESVAEQHTTLQAKVAHDREEMAAKRVTNTHLKDQMLEIKQRIDGLSERTVCPECRQPLTPAHKAKLEADYAQQGLQRKEQFRANERVCKELEASVAQGEAELKQLFTELAGRQSAHQRLATTQSQLSQAREAEKRLGQLQTEWAEHEAVLKGRQYAPQARALVLEMDTQVAALAYDEPGHQQVRARAAEMARAESDKQNLDRARDAATHLESRERDGQAFVARVSEDVAAAEQRIAALRADHDHYLEERGKLVQLETQLKATESLREAARVRHTQARAAVEHCEFLERRLAESLARQDSLLREQGVYAELATAFGKRGVQAMIIESAIPEIEQEANRLLARMTDGRMNVAFETQRDARSGGGTIETLDIKIADELGTRSYEMFSGGESFRVNFAIRIALSKLLARRAGTRLQLLVIDEGFGSQDAEGRDRIVECIRAIQDEFAKILVITHLDDLRERFPVRIDIRKTPFGSTISLN